MAEEIPDIAPRRLFSDREPHQLAQGVLPRAHDRESDRKAFTGKVPPEKLSTSGTIEPNRVGGEAGVPHPGIPTAP
ncbi:hypothetical protein ACIOML_22125 [Streptomyces anulatus]